MKNLVWDDEWRWGNAIKEFDSRDPSMPHGKGLEQTSQGWFRRVVYPHVYGFFYIRLMKFAHKWAAQRRGQMRRR